MTVRAQYFESPLSKHSKTIYQWKVENTLREAIHRSSTRRFVVLELRAFPRWRPSVFDASNGAATCFCESECGSPVCVMSRFIII